MSEVRPLTSNAPTYNAEQPSIENLRRSVRHAPNSSLTHARALALGEQLHMAVACETTCERLLCGFASSSQQPEP
jgi:hypothetical protein